MYQSLCWENVAAFYGSLDWSLCECVLAFKRRPMMRMGQFAPTSALVLLLKFSRYDCLTILKLNIMFLRLYRWVKFACFSLLLPHQLIMILMYRLDGMEQRWHLPRAKSYHSSQLIMLNGRTGNCWDLEQLEVPRCRLNSMTKTSGRLFFLFTVWGLGYPLSIKW